MAIDPNIKKKADDIRNKIYGKEVRESLASGLEAMSSDVVDTLGRQDEVESQFQDVIENTTDKDVISAPEIIAARDGEANLKSNIDKKHNEVTAQLAEKAKYHNQADFVEIIKDRTSYSRMRFQKLSDTSFLVTVDNGTNHVTYSFVKDPNDDFIKLDECYVGEITKSILSSDKPQNLEGNWVTSSPPHYYTTEVGASFTAKAKGSSLFLRHRKENRGGLWSIVVNGDEANPATISTWSESDIATAETLIIDGLDVNKYHTVKATFLGDDPNHPPSSGAGSSRGWINSTVGIYGKYDNPIKGNGIFASGSNKEMAFSIQRSGVTQWVPEHNNIGTAFNVPNQRPRIRLNNTEIDLDSLDVSEFVECTDFDLIQRVYARVNGDDVAEIRLTHHLDRTGVMSWTGNLKVLLDIKMSFMYPLMLPLDQNTLNKAYTSIGNSKISTGGGEDYYFDEETDQLISACGLSSNYTSLIGAGTVQYPTKTMRTNEVGGKPSEGRHIRFWQRETSPKIYFTAGQQYVPQIGDTYSWFAKIAMAKIPYIYQALKG